MATYQPVPVNFLERKHKTGRHYFFAARSAEAEGVYAANCNSVTPLIDPVFFLDYVARRTSVRHEELEIAMAAFSSHNDLIG